MTTTVLMDTFDAQMQDSADADMAIYLANVEPWAVEADMTDVDYKAVDESIEVDMDNQDEEMTEYEMQDDELARDGDAELVNVDVLDATAANSPALPPVVVVEGVDIPSAASPHQNLDIPLPAIPTPDGVDVDVDAADGPTQDQSLFTHPQSAAANVSVPLSSDSTSPPSGHSTSDIREAEAHILETAMPAGDEATSPRQDVVHEARDDDVSRSAEEGNHHDSNYWVAPATTVETGAADAAPADSPLTNGHVHNYEADATAHADYGDDAAAAEHSGALALHVDSLVEVVDGNAERQEISAPEETGEAATVSDPHEISEGIYIDPPPGVLLSVALMSEPVDCVLFNQPSVSGSQTPSGDAPFDAHSELTILLHHRPTLYYEPLSAVFQALREDEYLLNVAHLDDGELVIDAYDLQLVVAEDNAHTHELSLHDLDILHDGTDQSGPLRLQLRLNRPRFITRYYALRDQIARLNIAAEEAHESSHVEDPEAVSEAQDYIGNTEVRAEHGQEEVSAIEQQDTEHQHIEQQEAEQQEPENEILEDGADSADTGTQHVENSTEHRSASEVRPSVREEADPEAETTYEGDLDADEVHDYADVESGEYDDYAQNAEAQDDDERFGEELSPELGGATGHEDEQAQVFGDVETADDVQHVPSDLQNDAFDTHVGPKGADDLGNSEETLSDGDAGETVDDTDFPAPAEDDPELYDFDAEGAVPPELEEEESSSKELTAPFEQEGLVAGGTSSRGAEETEVYPVDNTVDNDGLDDFDDFDNVSPENTQLEQQHVLAQSNKTPKRTFDEVDFDEFGEEPEESPLDSPGSKRARVH